jgi:hypothetical protein
MSMLHRTARTAGRRRPLHEFLHPAPQRSRIRRRRRRGRAGGSIGLSQISEQWPASGSKERHKERPGLDKVSDVAHGSRPHVRLLHALIGESRPHFSLAVARTGTRLSAAGKAAGHFRATQLAS